MKLYTVKMSDGSNYKTFSNFRLVALLKVYIKYKKTRNTSYRKFRSKIEGILKEKY